MVECGCIHRRLHDGLLDILDILTSVVLYFRPPGIIFGASEPDSVRVVILMLSLTYFCSVSADSFPRRK